MCTFVADCKGKPMDTIISIDNINDWNSFNAHKTLHPLVSVIDFSKAQPREWGDAEQIRFQYGLYCIFLKDVKCGDLRYGRHFYDYQAGTLAFFSPGQSASMDNPKVTYQPMGHGLFFILSF